MAARRPLTRNRICRAALALADREGLGALTMRRVAGRLGVEAMTLYHHFENKDAMLDGTLDLLVERAKLPEGDLTPEEWVRGTAEAIRGLARTHPRAFPLLTRRPVPVLDPAVARPLEAGLAAFRRAGFDAEQAYYAVQVAGVALLPFGMMEAEVMLAPDPDHEAASHLTGLPAEEFPNLTALPGFEVELDRLWATAVESLVRGLCEPPGP